MNIRVLSLLMLLVASLRLHAQDLTWLVEQAPAISAILVQTLGEAPGFSGRVEINVNSALDNSTSSASGVVEFYRGNLRWEAKLSDVNAAQLTPNAKAVVRQISGEQFLLITRSDRKANFLILAGAGSYLEEALPVLRRASKKTVFGNEAIDGRRCTVERWTTVSGGATTNTITAWRAKDLKDLPAQVQIAHNSGTVRIRFKEVKLRVPASGRFDIPEKLSKYNSFEDLVQSVMIEKLKRRMGLQ